MASLNGFNAQEVDPSVGFEPIPAGKYLAVITESEMKPTKNGGGRYLQLTFQVIEGEYKNRLIWARLNMENPNTTAVNIARAELSAICRAVGVLAPKDSVDLHNLPLVITLGIKKRKDTDELTNVIKGYEPKSAGTSRPAPTAATNGKPPWKR